jgi:hypothetical protein
VGSGGWAPISVGEGLGTGVYVAVAIGVAGAVDV